MGIEQVFTLYGLGVTRSTVRLAHGNHPNGPGNRQGPDAGHVAVVRHAKRAWTAALVQPEQPRGSGRSLRRHCTLNPQSA